MSSQKKYTAPEVTEQARHPHRSRMGRASAQAASSRNGRTGISFGSLCALPRNQKRALLAYVLCVSSFRQLGSWAVLRGL